MSQPATEPKKKSKVGLIIGIVVGVVVLLILIGLAIWYFSTRDTSNGGGGGGCTSNTECSGSQICVGGTCTNPPTGCSSDADCSGDQICSDNVCIDPGCNEPVPAVVTDLELTSSVSPRKVTGTFTGIVGWLYDYVVTTGSNGGGSIIDSGVTGTASFEVNVPTSGTYYATVLGVNNCNVPAPARSNEAFTCVGYVEPVVSVIQSNFIFIEGTVAAGASGDAIWFTLELWSGPNGSGTQTGLVINNIQAGNFVMSVLTGSWGNTNYLRSRATNDNVCDAGPWSSDIAVAIPNPA